MGPMKADFGQGQRSLPEPQSRFTPIYKIGIVPKGLETSFDKLNCVLHALGKPSLKPTGEAMCSLTPYP